MATGTGTGVSAKRRKELREPDPFLIRLMTASEWIGGRRWLLAKAAIAVVLLAGAFAAWSEVEGRKSARAARSLARALVVANAYIRAADEPEEEDAPPEDDRPIFRSAKSRSLASLNAYRRTLEAYGDSPLAYVAKLGEAAALEDLGRIDEAKRAYLAVNRAEGVAADLRAQAVDGLARCLEAKDDLPGALRQLDALRTMEDGAFRDLAQFGRARILQRQGKTIQARELLRSIQQGLGAEGAPDRPYLRTQVEQRLRELDAASPEAAGGEGSERPRIKGLGKGR